MWIKWSFPLVVLEFYWASAVVMVNWRTIKNGGKMAMKPKGSYFFSSQYKEYVCLLNI